MKKILLKIIIFFVFSQLHAQEKSWISLPPMPTPRYGACSVVYHDQIWVIGGKGINENALNTVEIFDPVTKTWESKQPLQKSRFQAATLVYKDTIFVIGGEDENQKSLKSVECYNISSGTWKHHSDLNTDRKGLSATVYKGAVNVDGIIYVIGGYSSELKRNLNTIELWNHRKKQWEESSQWQLDRQRNNMATIFINDAIYIMGGLYLDPVSIVERLSIDTDSIEELSSMPEARFNFAVVSFQDTIYIIGGETSESNSAVNLAPSVLKYYVLKDKWYRESDNLNIIRSGLTAVTIENVIYIFGGKTIEPWTTNYRILDNAQKYEIPINSTGIKNSANQLPSSFTLYQNYPNPFNSMTRISFLLNEASENIILKIFDIQGRLINSYSWEILNSGIHSFSWNGKDHKGFNVSSGIYFYKIIINNKNTLTKKMMYLR